MFQRERQEAELQMTKEKDAQAEYHMRQKSKMKKVEDLPNVDWLKRTLDNVREHVEAAALEIEETEPGQNLGPHLKDLLADTTKNYSNGLARFRILPLLKTEDQVVACADELNNLKLDHREDWEEIEALVGIIPVDQRFFCYLQEIKIGFENLYLLRCGRDVLLRQWLKSWLSREEDKVGEAVEEAEEQRQKKIEALFKEQEIEVPIAYKPPYSRETEFEIKENQDNVEVLLAKPAM